MFCRCIIISESVTTLLCNEWKMLQGVVRSNTRAWHLAPLSFPLPSINGRLLAPRNLLSKTMPRGLEGGMGAADA